MAKLTHGRRVGESLPQFKEESKANLAVEEKNKKMFAGLKRGISISNQTGIGRNTIIRTSDGSEITGVTSVEIMPISNNELVTAKIECIVNDLDIVAELEVKNDRKLTEIIEQEKAKRFMQENMDRINIIKGKKL